MTTVLVLVVNSVDMMKNLSKINDREEEAETEKKKKKKGKD